MALTIEITENSVRGRGVGMSHWRGFLEDLWLYLAFSYRNHRTKGIIDKQQGQLTGHMLKVKWRMAQHRKFGK